MIRDKLDKMGTNRIIGYRGKGQGEPVGNQLLSRDVFKQVHVISGPEF